VDQSTIDFVFLFLTIMLQAHSNNMLYGMYVRTPNAQTGLCGNQSAGVARKSVARQPPGSEIRGGPFLAEGDADAEKDV
jgi:hypothetical protein